MVSIRTSYHLRLLWRQRVTVVVRLRIFLFDIVLAVLLLIGGVIGAQYGAIFATRVKPDLLRFGLAIIILLVALRMALGLAWRPDEVYSIEFL